MDPLSGLFQLTGSFRIAVHGLLAALMALSFLAFRALLVGRAFKPLHAAGLAVLFLTFPTILIKSLEFGSVVICIPALLLLIGLAEKRRWGWFYVVWAVAVASRQSALAWLALPLGEVVIRWQACPGGRGRSVIAPAGVVAGGIATYAGFALGMNQTHAQAVITDRLVSNLDPGQTLQGLAVCIAVFITAGGLGRFMAWGLGGATVPASEGGRSQTFLKLGGAFAVLAFYGSDPLGFLHFEHSLFGLGAGGAYLVLAFATAACGWLVNPLPLTAVPACAALACAALVSLRSPVWDYYLIDVGLLGFFSWRCLPAQALPGRARRIVGWLVVGALAAMHVGFVSNVNQLLNRHAGVIRLCEPALRAGIITPADLSVAPFGYQAWHLYPYFIAHEGRAVPDIADFRIYLAPQSLVLELSRVDDPAAAGRGVVTTEHVGTAVIAGGVWPWQWREARGFRLKRTGRSAPVVQLDRATYRFAPFPLTDAEWRLAAQARP
ncbi:MAG: hypothetical protein KF897_14365 [Opitutaceae bacterium]|nr:hypothetical protein [Opitutaceae bacterium]